MIKEGVSALIKHGMAEDFSEAQLQELQDSFVALEKEVQEGRAAAADTAVALAERIGTMEAKGGAAGPFVSQMRHEP